ncbi:oligosaccharide repeat unit polymerase [Pseudomonadota bacterium]|nr:oligosaccharide repeat unit polymerase [Pseudomonadota bacterium]
MLEHLPIIVLITEILLLVLYSIYIYRNIFNPLAIFACINVGLFTIGSYLNTILFKLDTIEYPINYLNEAVWISAIWLASFSLGFFPAPKWIYHKYSFPANYLKGKNLFPLYLLLALMLLTSFIALCIFSDTLLWLTNPREAYLFFRVGVGHFYISFIWTALLFFAAILFFQRPNFWGLVYWLFIFLIIMYFSGKKSVIMSIFVIASVYYHFYIKNFSFRVLIILAFTIFSFLILLISFQGNLSLIETLMFFDYIDTTSLFLYRFDEFGLYYGKAFLTSYWSIVPRFLFPEKPFEYGASLIHKVLYPGVAEKGHTSGYLIWSEYYLDLGIVGVILYGFILGLFKRCLFNVFLKNKNNFLLFCLTIHFCFKTVWVLLPTAIVFSFIFICYKMSKLKIR